MKYLFTICLILLSTILTFAQNDTIPAEHFEEIITTDSLPGIPFVAYWAVGDSYDFKVSKIKKRWKEGVLTKNDSSSYVCNFTVLDSTETSYRIKWSYKSSLDNFQLPSLLLKKMPESTLTEIIYQTTELGEFVSIENWEEIAAEMKSTFDALLEGLTEEGDVPRKELEKSLKPFMEIYQTKQGIESMVLKELQQFHFPFGVEFSPVDTIYYEDELPNMMGGDPIRSDVALYIDAVDYDNGFCILEERRSLNKEDTRKFLTDVFRKMGFGEDEEMAEILDAAKFDVNDTNTYEYYYYPGVPLKITCKRETNMKTGTEGQIAIELTEIELQ